MPRVLTSAFKKLRHFENGMKRYVCNREEIVEGKENGGGGEKQNKQEQKWISR